jgi:ribosomal protein S18 acetylase RimI-like enzyme
MRAADVVAVADMVHALAEFHSGSAEITATDLRKNSLGPDRLCSVLVAVADGQPIGFVLTYDWHNFVQNIRVRHIDLMFVVADFRRRGVGETMMTTTATHAIKDGCGRITVGAQQNNEHANGFYKKLGFYYLADPSNRYRLGDTGLLALSQRGD